MLVLYERLVGRDRPRGPVAVLVSGFGLVTRSATWRN
jgi:hypothetical protein